MSDHNDVSGEHGAPDAVYAQTRIFASDIGRPVTSLACPWIAHP
jgi:hypothetical protein